MKQFTSLLPFVFYVFSSCSVSRQSAPLPAEPFADRETLRVVFWNVENAFDTINDPLTRDDEYTPEGARHWNGYRYRLKLRNLAQTLVALGGWELPAVIGMCEVENRQVLYDLLNTTILKQTHYQVIHEESADPRGIDPVFIYDPARFRPYTHAKVELVYPNGDTGRHILYMAGCTREGDTLHFFMNHWPSKYSGARETMPKRMCAARTLLAACRALWQRDSMACIIAGGDFNDEPFEASVSEGLEAADPAQYRRAMCLYNLALTATQGSHKFRDHWALIDQVLVSGGGLKRLVYPAQYTAALPFLLKEDLTYTGMKPFRTYNGFSWEGGYADHLPVYTDLYVK